MPIDFSDVNATLAQTETEIAEHETALQALADARTALTDAQSVVATAQQAVTDATGAESTEKADVVAGITTAITQLNELLSQLQE